MNFAEQVKELKNRKQELLDQEAKDLATLRFRQAQIRIINWELECLTGHKQ